MNALRQAVREALRVPAMRRRRRQMSAIRRAGRDTRAVWEVTADMLLRYGGASSGNNVEILCDGDDVFERMWHSMDSASKRVWHETYILEPDRVGQRMIEVLAHAARRGCQVRLLYDALGSPRVTEAFLKPLRDAAKREGQVEIDRFNPVFMRNRRLGFFTRDHRKITIIDDRVAFAGGMNTSEDYAGPRLGKATFRDCHAEFRGPCVRDLAAVTLKSLNLMRDVNTRAIGPRPARGGGMFVQVLSSRGMLGRRAVQHAMRVTVRHAVERCMIVNPYFLPPQRLMSALEKAAQRGVEVRILTSGLSDVPMVRRASQHIYGHLLRHGVRIFEYFGSTLHAKTMTIDGLYSTVGSFNLDTWSHKRNLEVNVGIIDAGAAASLEQQFESDLAQAKEVTLDNWTRRRWW